MKKLFFSAMVAVVAVSGAFASVNSLRATTVYGTLNAGGACPTAQPNILCNPNQVDNPICRNAELETLFTTGSGLCTTPLFTDSQP